MSLPTIPDINPDITLDRCDAINLLLSSIAMEEIGLSHILNAEGEKLQTFLKNFPCDLHGYIKLNDSVNTTLRTIVKSQILLQFKLEDVITLNATSGCDSTSSEDCKSHYCKKCKCEDCKCKHDHCKKCKCQDCKCEHDYCKKCKCQNCKCKHIDCEKCKSHDCKYKHEDCKCKDVECIDFQDNSLCYCPNKECQCPKCKEKKKKDY